MAERALQKIFTELIRQLDEKASETSEKDDRIRTLTEALLVEQPLEGLRAFGGEK